jgi:hypothetical protein
VLLLVFVPVATAQVMLGNPRPIAADEVPAVPPVVTENPPATPSSSPNDPLPLGMGTFLGLQTLTGFQEPRAAYRIVWVPEEPLTNQPGHLGVIQENLSVGEPLWHDDVNFVSLSANVRGESFFTHAVLPDTGRPFPDELWSVRFGTSYSHHFENGWTAGAGISVGSSSDELFHSTREMEIGANAFLIVPQGEHNAWLFTLMYSPTSELAFPIPGVAYLWQPSDRLRVNVGLPFQVMYRPIDEMTLDFSYMLLRTVHARATYHVTPRIGVYTGYDWSNESYFLEDRQDMNERFFSYDQRVSVGVQAKITPNFLLELSGGYDFDRFYFAGSSYSDRNTDRVDVNPGPFIGLQGRVHW